MERTDNIAARMSERLLAVADMMGKTRFKCIADVGCDHGYVSIRLVQNNTTERAIAMDVRKGPLSMAQANIAEAGLEDRIEVRLSDGLSALSEGEADGLVIAGMGGKLMMSILEQGDPVSLGIKTALLQPQSDIEEFRGYLRSRGYEVVDERIVLDEGKYYFPMLVDFARGDAWEDAVDRLEDMMSGLNIKKIQKDDILRLSDRYGVYNILRWDSLLISYLEHGRQVAESIINNLDAEQHPERYAQLSQQIEDIRLLLAFLNNR